MLFRRSCSWCFKAQDVTAMPAFCTDCGHRIDVDRSSCNCPKCLRYGTTRYEPQDETVLDESAADSFSAGLTD